MAINLNREGVALNAEERNKRNQNWTAIEQEVAGIGSNISELDAVSADTLSQINGLKEETATQKTGLTTVDNKINTVNSTLNEKITTSDTATNKRIDNVVIEAGDAAFDKVVDAAALEWKEPVATFANLATTYPNATEAFTAQTTSDGSVYRFNGSEWKKIQQVDAGPINEVDTRLTAQLADISLLNPAANADVPIGLTTYEYSNQNVHPSKWYGDTPFAGYKHWMGYTPYANGDGSTENPSLRASLDGVNWTLPFGVPDPVVARPVDYLEGAHLSDIHIDVLGNEMFMWYRYSPPSGAVNSIMYLIKSTDAKVWTVKVQTDLPSGIVSPSMIYDTVNSKWFCYAVNTANGYKVDQYESVDGITWVLLGSITTDLTGYTNWHTEVRKVGSLYYMLNSAYPNGQSNNATVLFAHSSFDGITFTTLNNKKPIIAPTEGGWDSRQIYKATMIYLNGLFYVWYSAAGKDNRWFTGLTIGTSLEKLKGFSLTSFNKLGDLQVDGILRSRGRILYHGSGIALEGLGRLHMRAGINGEMSLNYAQGSSIGIYNGSETAVINIDANGGMKFNKNTYHIEAIARLHLRAGAAGEISLNYGQGLEVAIYNGGITPLLKFTQTGKLLFSNSGYHLESTQNLHMRSGSSANSVMMNHGQGGAVEFYGGSTALKSKIGTNGEYEAMNTDIGFILKSPNGTRWRIKVGDDGTLNSTALV